MTAPHTDPQPGSTDFVFIGGSLALDLVNTEVMIRRKRHDLLATPNDVVRWWEHVWDRYPGTNSVRVTGNLPSADAQFLATTKTLRDSLRRIFGDIVGQRMIQGEDLEHLNGVLMLATPGIEQDTATIIRSVYRAANTLQGAVLFPVALSAKLLLTEGNLSRVHRCGNDRCILFFYDDTRSATRHWCSVGCMNRARSSRRYQDEKQQREIDNLRM